MYSLDLNSTFSKSVLCNNNASSQGKAKGGKQ